MSRYRKIDPRIWNDEKVRTLSDDGKLAFLFVLTHPHMTALGAMRANIEGLARELGWSAKRFQNAIRPAIELTMVEYDEQASYVGLPNFLRYNEPEGPNSVSKAWVQALDLIPECAARHRLIARCRSYLASKSPEFLDRVGDAIRDAFGDPSREACRIQEQEQEPEQDTLPAGAAAPVVCRSSRNGSYRSRRPPLGSRDARFDAFYAAYPRHEAEYPARRAWTALQISDSLSEQIMSALAAHERRWLDEATPTDKIPYPGNWLADRRWEDQLPAPAPNPYENFPTA